MMQYSDKDVNTLEKYLYLFSWLQDDFYFATINDIKLW